MLKNKVLIGFFSLLLLVFIFAPMLVLAQDAPAIDDPAKDDPAKDDKTGIIQLSDPLGSNNAAGGEKDFEITDLIGRIANAMIAPVGAIAFLFFVIGGFYWIFSGGNEERIKTGKDIMLWTLVGIAIIFFAYAILSFVFKVILPTPPAA